VTDDTIRLRLDVTDACHGCGVCVEACPRGAISMTTAEPAPVAVIAQTACDLCRACLDACPVEAILEPYPPLWRPDDA
jgi:ferredoxin